MSGAPRRLLLTTDAVGGVWTYALELAAALTDAGTAIELAVLGPAATPTQCQAAAAAGATLHHTGLALDWTAEKPAALEQISLALAALARRLGVDRVQLHSPALLGAAAWPAPVLAVAHSCVGTWWEAVRGGAPPPADFTWRMVAMAHGLRAADTVIAPSEAMADALRRVYGTRRRIGVVPNGRASLADQPPINAARHGVLAAGRLWDEAKNIATLEEAAALMTLPVRAAGHAPARTAPPSRSPPSRRSAPWTATLWPPPCKPPASSPPQRCTNPSAWRCWKPHKPACRWSSPTSRPSANSGAASPCSCPRATLRPGPPR